MVTASGSGRQPRQEDGRQLLRRALIPPLTIALTLVTAGALLLTAAAIVPPPLPRGGTSAPMPPPGGDTMGAGSRLTPLVQVPSVLLPPGPIMTGLARLTYAPGA